MTPERAKELLPIFTAYANGELIQFSLDGGPWKDYATFSGLALGRTDTNYRIKPKPVTRLWSKPEDVPGPVCWVRFSVNGDHHLIGHVAEAGVKNCTGSCTIQWSQLKSAEHSTDRKTWLPCTITEQSE